MRLTTPFSSPPTSRRKMTWATSGRPANRRTGSPASLEQIRTGVHFPGSSKWRAASPRRTRAALCAQRPPPCVHRRARTGRRPRHRRRGRSARPSPAGTSPSTDSRTYLPVYPVPVPDEQLARCAGDLRLDRPGSASSPIATELATGSRVFRHAALVGRHERVARRDHLGAGTLVAVVAQVDAGARLAPGIGLLDGRTCVRGNWG